ncbi:MAG: PQ-loop domain-containing transporter [Candidatus Gracilibacteria bacterium]|jgi:MtN3 and saliva related transmembrane protein
MQNSTVEIVGYIAGALIPFSLLPQVVKSWKTKSTKDISAIWNFVYLSGLILWVIYGFLIASWPVVIMMSVEAGLALFLFVLKVRYR